MSASVNCARSAALSFLEGTIAQIPIICKENVENTPKRPEFRAFGDTLIALAVGPKGAAPSSRGAAQRRRGDPGATGARPVMKRTPRSHRLNDPLVCNLACFPRRRGASRPPCGGGTGWGVAPCRSNWRSRRGQALRRNAISAQRSLRFPFGATPHPGPPPQGGRECAPVSLTKVRRWPVLNSR